MLMHYSRMIHLKRIFIKRKLLSPLLLLLPPPPPPAAPPPPPPAPPIQPAASHPLFQTAQATLVKRKFLSLKEKKDLLVRIRDKLNQDLIKAVFPGGDALSHEMQRVYHDVTMTGSTQYMIKKHWSLAYSATLLAKFFTGMEIRKERSDQQKRESRRTRAAADVLEDVAEAVKKAMKDDEQSTRLKASKQKKGKVYWQKGQSRVQDDWDFDPAKLDRFPCPICDNYSIMPVDDLREVEKHNLRMEKEHDTAVAAHDEVSRDKKGRPRLKGILDVRMACYCCKFNCNLDPRGGTCPECSKPGIDYLEYDPQTGSPVACNCPLCNCQCSIYFYLTDRFNIDKNEERLRSGPEPEEEQYSGNPLGKLQDALSKHVHRGRFDATLDNCQPLGSAQFEQDAYGHAADYTKTDIHFQSDVAFRNTIQKMVPRGIRTRVDGLGVNQLRGGTIPERSGPRAQRGPALSWGPVAAQQRGGPAQQRGPVQQFSRAPFQEPRPVSFSASERRNARHYSNRNYSDRGHRNDLGGDRGLARLPSKYDPLASRLRAAAGQDAIDIAGSSSTKEDEYTPVGRNIHPRCTPHTDEETQPFHVKLRQQILMRLTDPGAVEDTPLTQSALHRINTLLSSSSAGDEMQEVQQLMTWIHDFSHLFNGDIVATIGGLIKTLKRHAASDRMQAARTMPAAGSAWMSAAGSARMPAAQLPTARLPTAAAARLPTAAAARLPAAGSARLPAARAAQLPAARAAQLPARMSVPAAESMLDTRLPRWQSAAGAGTSGVAARKRSHLKSPPAGAGNKRPPRKKTKRVARRVAEVPPPTKEEKKAAREAKKAAMAAKKAAKEAAKKAEAAREAANDRRAKELFEQSRAKYLKQRKEEYEAQRKMKRSDDSMSSFGSGGSGNSSSSSNKVSRYETP